jgi:hypothetical protein
MNGPLVIISHLILTAGYKIKIIQGRGYRLIGITWNAWLNLNDKRSCNPIRNVCKRPSAVRFLGEERTVT